MPKTTNKKFIITEYEQKLIDASRALCYALSIDSDDYPDQHLYRQVMAAMGRVQLIISDRTCEDWPTND